MYERVFMGMYECMKVCINGVKSVKCRRGVRQRGECIKEWMCEDMYESDENSRIY